MDSIIFLGTAGDLSTAGKGIRKSGGIALIHDDIQFIIDPGPGCVVQASNIGVNLRQTTAVLATHSHINHCNDLNAVLAVMTHNGLDKTGVLAGTPPVLASSSILTDFHKNCVEKILPIEAGKKISIEEIDITPLKTSNEDKYCVGLKFSFPKYTLSYTSDTELTREIMEEYLQSDILILNVQNPFSIRGKGLNTDDAVSILKYIQPQLAIITHFGTKMISAPPLHEARELQKQTGVPVLASEDGMKIDPTAYLNSTKRKIVDFLVGNKEEKNGS